MNTLASSLSSVGISAADRYQLIAQREQLDRTLPKTGDASSSNTDSTNKKATATTGTQTQQLTPEQQRQIDQLQQTDQRVRAHEQAHIAAGRGVVTSGPNYTYTYGPDGKAYATGGEVGIDTSAESKPQDNIDKGIRIQAAALAPRDPSATDYRVATIGGQIELKGRTELAEQKRSEASNSQGTAKTGQSSQSNPAAEESPGVANDTEPTASATGSSATRVPSLANAYSQNLSASGGSSASIFSAYA